MNEASEPAIAWSSWREAALVVARPKHVKRTITIALSVGTIFFAMNQLPLVLAGHATAAVWVKVALTYLTPLVVSNVGILTATRRTRDSAESQRTSGKAKMMRLRRLLIMLIALASALAAPALAAGPERSGVGWFSDGSAVPGAYSTLVTDPSGASMTLRTAQLPAGDAVSVWWVIFNNPQACSGPARDHPFRCGPSDLSNPLVMTSIQYAAGHVVGTSGPVTFAGHLSRGDTSACASRSLPCSGLLNPTGADIHLVIHDHGPATPGEVDQEIHSFDVCSPTCTDLQFSVHEQ